MDPSAELLRRDHSFRSYWTGQALSQTGSQITAFALPLVSALALDAGPAEVGLVATAAMLPYLLFALVVGHHLQGLDKRRVMIPADLLQAALIALVPLAWLGGFLSIPLLAVIAFLSGTAGLVFGLASFAYVPQLVAEKDLMAANRAVQTTRTVTEVAGPGLAGLFVSLFGPALALILDALSYLASALGVSRSRPHPQAQDDRPAPSEPAASIWSGMRVLLRNPYLRALTIFATLYNLAEQIFLLNLMLWAITQQGVSASAYGFALAVGGLGAFLGTLVAMKLAERVGLGRGLGLAAVLGCWAPLFAGVWPLTGVSLAALIGAVMFVTGLGMGNANVFALTLRQKAIPRNQLARSGGAYTQLMYGSIPVGTALAGLIGQNLGTRSGVIIGGIGLALSSLPMLSGRMLRLRDGQASVDLEPAHQTTEA